MHRLCRTTLLGWALAVPLSGCASLGSSPAGSTDATPFPRLVQESKPAEATGQTGEESNAELAKKLSNPVASLISVPFQFNFANRIGEDDGRSTTLKVQPVIPISLDEDWNLISRTILPLVSQEDVINDDRQSGIGDTTQSLFLSPVRPTEGGWIWGAGPVVLVPTASRDELGTGKWGLGPTAVVLKQDGPWTIGALGNQIWSVAGDGDRADVNQTFLQPFLAYTWPNAVTASLNTESTYDWEARRWTVPINGLVSKVVKIGDQLVSLGAGATYYAESPHSGPDGWGVRLQITLLYPRR